MILDDVRFNVLNRVSKNNNIDIQIVNETIDGFYKGIIFIMETKKDNIKVDYFGKFLYNEDYRNKREKMILEFKNLTMVQGPTS
jgi:hypothetical protein